jgi:hypothetical protein
MIKVRILLLHSGIMLSHMFLCSLILLCHLLLHLRVLLCEFLLLRCILPVLRGGLML